MLFHEIQRRKPLYVLLIAAVIILTLCVYSVLKIQPNSKAVTVVLFDLNLVNESNFRLGRKLTASDSHIKLTRVTNINSKDLYLLSSPDMADFSAFFAQAANHENADIVIAEESKFALLVQAGLVLPLPDNTLEEGTVYQYGIDTADILTKDDQPMFRFAESDKAYIGILKDGNNKEQAVLLLSGMKNE